MPFKHTCWLLQAFPSTVTRAALTSQSERTFSGFMLQCNYSLCKKGTSLEFAYCSVTAYCALIQCEDILYKMTWSVFCDVPKQFTINTEVTTQWPSWRSPTFAPLINQFTPPLHHRSISSPHLCTNDQSVHPTFAPLINQFTPLCTADQSVQTTFASLINWFTLHGFWDRLKCPLWLQVITNLSTTPNKTTTKNMNDCYHPKTRSKHKTEHYILE